MNVSSTKLSVLVVSALLLGACGGGGNAGETAELEVVLMSAPPSETHLRYASFSFAAQDAAGYECALDGAAFSPCQSPLFDPALSLGQHRFQVRAVTASGAIGDAVSHDWWISDVLADGHQDLIATNVSPGPVEENSWRGIFRINCDFAHSSYDDPIVFPDQPDAAHLHRFYGNTLVDAHTTLTSLYTEGESSCQGNLLNLSSYWMPALLAPVYDQISGERLLDSEGEPAWQVVPAVVGNDDVAHEVFYYSAGVDDLDSIQPIPPGLRMIAGDTGTRPGETQDTAIARWHCQTWESDDASNPLFSATIPECEEPDRVRLDLFFPSCWDGENLDSADHRSHMAYPVNEGGPDGTRCPDSHPVPVVRVSYHLAFGVKPEYTHPLVRNSAGWRLASDMYEVSALQPGGLSLHGDWFNAWHPAVMEALLANCIQSELDCHDGNLGNGLRLSGTRPGSQFEPAIFNQGMGH